MVKQDLQKKINDLRNAKTNELALLVNYMLGKGFTLPQWKSINNANDNVVNALLEYFSDANSTVAVGDESNQNKEIGNSNLNLNDIKELGVVVKKSTKKTENKKDNKEKSEGMENLVKETAITKENMEVNNPAKDELAPTQNLNDGTSALQIPPTDDLEDKKPADDTKENPKDTTENKDENKIDDTQKDEKPADDIKEDDKPADDTKELPPSDDIKKDDKIEDKKEDKKEDNSKDDNKGNDNKGNDNKNDNSDNKGNNKGNDSKGNSDKNTPRALTIGQIKRMYKTIDNITYIESRKQVTLDDVTKISNEKYTLYLTGKQLADMWVNHELFFNPTMQRGVKTTIDNQEVATFSDKHVRDLEEALLNGDFEPTQIHFAILTDDNETTFNYDEDGNTLEVNGKIQLLDGQHRTRMLVRVDKMMAVDPTYKKVDLNSLLFNVEVHVVDSQRARTIYAGIDKNLKLDKSQVRQLSVDEYALIVNELNQNIYSPLRGKIATCKPVGKGLVLFSTLYDAIKDNVDIDKPADRKKVVDKICVFFNYMIDKLPSAFGGSVEKRLAFRENNLLNENNFFHALIAVALKDSNNYRKNIDKLVANVDHFKKNNKVWLDGQAVKVRAKDKDKKDEEKGYAMANSKTVFKFLVEETFRVLNIKNTAK